MVETNCFHLADKLADFCAREQFNWYELKEKWEKFGGNSEVLKKTINNAVLPDKKINL